MVNPSQNRTRLMNEAMRPQSIYELMHPQKQLKLKCRACGQSNLQSVLNLGNVPLSNAFLDSPDAPEERYPLELAFCPHCALVQITETVSPEKLFSQYLYFSSVSQTMLEHAREMVDTLMDVRVPDDFQKQPSKLNKDSLVIELASNDGYLLQYFKAKGIPVLGIDPARNIAEVANARGIPTICEFFGERLARTLPKADVVIANNVLGHVANLQDFVAGIYYTLKEDGIAVIEVPYLRDMIERTEFDTIYHEHLCYFSVTALEHLFLQSNLKIIHAECINIHGGSLRIYAQRMSGQHWTSFDQNPNNRTDWKMWEEEKTLGIDRMDYYRQFAAQVERKKEEQRAMLTHCKINGKVAAYGAAAKGVMTLNILEVGAETIDYVIDDTPAKQGKFMAGSHIPIVPSSQMGTPDFIVILAWNWAREIMDKHPDFKGKWVTLE